MKTKMKTTRKLLVGLLGALTMVSATALPAAETKPDSRPNIVLIYADDIGYGDFGCYGATKVKTPNVDRLAAQGLRFTDAHTSDGLCTPSRYSLLTGTYAFRDRVSLVNADAALLIAPGKTTLPSLLKRAGYATGVVGKWHLGLGTKPTDYNREIKPGPLEIGFDYSWIMPATGDRVPCVWVENHRVVNLDPNDPIKINYQVKRGEPRSVLNGIPRIGEQLGGKAALWNDEKIAAVLVEKSCAFIAQQKDKPFFLYLSTHDIHVPRAPDPQFRGKSEIGLRGDALTQFDWTVGQVLAKLDELKLTDNTLVILSSDNGGVFDNNGPDWEHGVGSPEARDNKMSWMGHNCNGALRGGKSSIYEGGTRVPFITRWPGRIKPGVSDALISQVDLLGSMAALTGQSLAKADAPDSLNCLPALLGEKQGTDCRDQLIERGSHLGPLGLRKGSWKYIASQTKAPKSGKAKDGAAATKVVAGELYDLAADLGETNNVAAQHPEIVAAMSAQLEALNKEGRTRP